MQVAKDVVWSYAASRSEWARVTMTDIEAIHCTTYRYASPVNLLPHRLTLRPRESRELRLNDFALSITPSARLSWAHDVFGNAIATAQFEEAASVLVIESRSRITLTAPVRPVFEVAESARLYPFAYSHEESTDLGALAVPQYPDPDGVLDRWAGRFVMQTGTDSLALLKDLSVGVATAISYQSREVEGTQTPIETLRRGWGSCRDFAVLFVETVRTLGFGARIVSGYLLDPEGIRTGSAGPGSTHAWAEVYLPGAGWVTFDPTNRSVGGSNLVPVAVGRGIEQVQPVLGSFVGSTAARHSASGSTCGWSCWTRPRRQGEPLQSASRVSPADPPGKSFARTTDMANRSPFKPSRMDMQRNKTHEAWREIVDAQAAARDEKLERLNQARALRAAELSGEAPPVKDVSSKAKKARKKK